MEENYLGFVAIHKIRGVASFGGTRKQFVKIFSMKIFSTNSQKFSPTKVSRYTVCNGKDIRVSFCKTNSAGKYHKMINLLRSACKKSSKCKTCAQFIW